MQFSDFSIFMSTIINHQHIVWLACSIHVILINLQRKKLQRNLLIFLQNRFFFFWRRNNLSLYISFEQLTMFAPWQSDKSLRNHKLGSDWRSEMIWFSARGYSKQRACRIYSIECRGVYQIFRDSSAAFIRGRRLYEGGVYLKSNYFFQTIVW